MTNKEILDIAMAQIAVDLNCDKSDFLKSKNVVVLSKVNPGARKYITEPFLCDLVSFGNNIVASVSSEIKDFIRNYIDKFKIPDSFEPPNIHVLNQEFNKYGHQIRFMATQFLPDVNLLTPKTCSCELKALEPEDFADLYKPEWNYALSEKRKESDVLAIGAYDRGKLIGLAGCSADCENLWQIGIDVLPEYRKQGIASTLTSNLAIEILNRDKVPCYCTAWSNIRSIRNAAKSGFTLAWVQMTARKIEEAINAN